MAKENDEIIRRLESKFPDLVSISDHFREWLDQYEIAKGREPVSRKGRERYKASHGEGQRIIGVEVHNPIGQHPTESVNAEVLDQKGNLVGVTRARGVSFRIDQL